MNTEQNPKKLETASPDNTLDYWYTVHKGKKPAGFTAFYRGSQPTVPRPEGEWVNKNPDVILLLWGSKWPKKTSNPKELTWKMLGRGRHFLLQWSPHQQRTPNCPGLSSIPDGDIA